MKMSKKIRTLVSTALISAMVLTMGGMSAFAEEATDLTLVDVKKTVTTDGKTFAPETIFKFNIEASTIENETSAEGYVVYTGSDVPANGLTVNDATAFKFENDNITNPSDAYEKTGALKVNLNEFTKPGIYHYVLTEVDDKYEGVKYDTTSYDVYVYIEQDESGTNKVAMVTGVKKDNGTTVKVNLDFTNEYGSKGNETDIHNVVIKKVVKGNQGDKQKQFDFDVRVDGTSGEKYYVEYLNATTGDTVTLVLTSGESQTIKLKNDQEITIYGLSKSDKVTVDESDYSGDGYTTTYTATGVEPEEGDELVVKDSANKEDRLVGVTSEDGATITVTNTKDVSAPTGIVMTFGPYVLLIALAGVFATLFFRRKREEF